MSFGGNEYDGKSASILIEVVVRFPPPYKNGIFTGTQPRFYLNFITSNLGHNAFGWINC